MGMSGTAVQAAAGSTGRSDSARPHSLTGLDRVFAFVMILAVAFVHFQLAGSNKFGVLDGELGDTDAYTWMVRATDLMRTGGWFDATLDRVGPPEGLQQHWTRPTDALIAGGALPLTLFMETDEALFLSGTLVSPLLHLIGLAVLLWGAGPLLGRGRVPLLGILYLTQAGIIGYSAAGRPDHHALILLLTNALIVLALRVALRPPDRRLSLGLGAVMALGLWTGAEFLVTVFGCLTGFGLLWLMQGRQSEISGKMLWTGIGAFAAGAVALLLERGGGLLAPAFQVDRFSAFHVWLMAVTAGFWAAVQQAENRNLAVSTLKTRAGLATGIAALAGVTVALLFPQALALDLVPMDPFYRQTRYENILEFQPLITGHAIAKHGLWDVIARTVFQIGIFLPALGFLVWTLIRERSDPRWPMWLVLAAITGVMLLVYTAQGGLEFRDAPFLQLAALIPYAELCFRIIRAVGARFSGLRLSLIRPLAIGGLIGWYVFPAVTLTLAPDEDGPGLTGRNACPVKHAASVLRGLDDPARLETVMAFTDFGPEIMYRTPHAVLSIPNHKAQPGYRLTWDAMTSPEPEAARRLLLAGNVDFVLICDSSITRSFYGQLGAKNTFREQLIAGPAPGWLTPVEMPEEVEGFHLFRVISDRKAVP
jgi:uncharacterized membrane protein YbaN (DUF454 family)